MDDSHPLILSGMLFCDTWWMVAFLMDIQWCVIGFPIVIVDTGS
jgi:hypothetical protein